MTSRKLPPRMIGYARVSTAEQSTRMQKDALMRAGCIKIFIDEDASGRDRNRPALKRALAQLRPGDTLIVWKLDRLARSLQDLMDITKELEAKGVHFESLTEKLDTSSAYGEFTFHIIAAVAQMERRLISERTIEGICAARQRGRRIGRPRALSPDQVETAYALYRARRSTKREIARRFGVSRITLDRALRRHESCAAPIV